MSVSFVGRGRLRIRRMCGQCASPVSAEGVHEDLIQAQLHKRPGRRNPKVASTSVRLTDALHRPDYLRPVRANFSGQSGKRAVGRNSCKRTLSANRKWLPDAQTAIAVGVNSSAHSANQRERIARYAPTGPSDCPIGSFQPDATSDVACHCRSATTAPAMLRLALIAVGQVEQVNALSFPDRRVWRIVRLNVAMPPLWPRGSAMERHNSVPLRPSRTIERDSCVSTSTSGVPSPFASMVASPFTLGIRRR